MIVIFLILFFAVAFTAINAVSVPHQFKQKNSSALISSFEKANPSNPFAYKNVSFAIAGSHINLLVAIETPSSGYEAGITSGESCYIYDTNSTISLPATGLSVYIKDTSMTNANTEKIPETQYFINGTYFCELSFSIPEPGTFNVTTSFTVVPVLTFGVYHFAFPGKNVQFNMTMTGFSS